MTQPNSTETVDVWSLVEGVFGFLSDVSMGNTHLIVTIEGKPVAAVISMDELKRLESISEGTEKKGGL